MYALVSGIIIGYITITIYEVFYKPSSERVSDCLLALRYTRFIAFTSKNVCVTELLRVPHFCCIFVIELLLHGQVLASVQG